MVTAGSGSIDRSGLHRFEAGIGVWVSGLIDRHPHIACAVYYLSRADLFKGGVACALLWLQ